ncbi:MAG: 3-deoxy-8-phosphooctulonate synthase [Sedimentisphaerales bacterium]|nr:3-deoxy-8-phosphooctulonate synthase [Sedimentisphaerales bacterium]
MKHNSFQIGAGSVNKLVRIGLKEDLFVIAGPCVIEDEQACRDIAAKLVEITDSVGVGLVFKASFDKANRSSIKSYRGPGLEKGLKVLSKIRSEFSIPVLTDVHEANQVKSVADVVDCLQVPAFLCRQTDLLCACGQTGKPVNVKKGQFMSPEEMGFAVQKIRDCGNEKVLLTERGTFFGYNRLVNDMGGISIMKGLDCPVVFDATHSTQMPGGLGTQSGGQREVSPILARAAVAAGANGLFLEVHTEPEKAKSDSACIMPIEWAEDTLKICKEIFEIVRQK